MIITIDVSAAVEVVMGRPLQSAIIPMLEKAEWVVAPTLYIYEAANVMWKYHKIGNLPTNELIQPFRHLLELVDEFIEADQLADEAISVACELNQPAYDTCYLITCRKRNAILLTLDSKLAVAAEKAGINVASLNDK